MLQADKRLKCDRMLRTFKSLSGHIADLHVALESHEEKLEPNYNWLIYVCIKPGGPTEAWI